MKPNHGTYKLHFNYPVTRHYSLTDYLYMYISIRSKMLFKSVVGGILLVQCIGSFGLKCENYFTANNVQLIIDYAKLKNIRYIVILEENIKLGKQNPINYYMW